MKKSRSICAFLGLKIPWWTNTFYKMEREVCEHVIAIFDKIIMNNLQNEIKNSPIILTNDEKEIIDLILTYDMVFFMVLEPEKYVSSY